MWQRFIDLLNYRPVAHILASSVKHTPMLNPRFSRKRAAKRLAPSVSCFKQQTANRKHVEFVFKIRTLRCTPLEFRTGFLARGF